MSNTLPADRPAASSATLATHSIHPNDYNPNRMTDEEYAELVMEVKHLGRLPKPVIVRPNGDGYQIVDGEHGWRAAQEVGLAEIPCEVIEADDFEARRQTFKRNEHGTHKPLLLGKMFQQMMTERGLSRRKLAEEIEVSEGTIRNALEFVKAEEVRNSYAAEHPESVRNSCAPSIESLSLRQARAYNCLPPMLANLWLASGADLKVLYGVKTKQQAEDGEGEGRLHYCGRHDYERYEQARLVDFLPESKIRSPRKFAQAIKQLRKWDTWERSWVVGGIKRKQLRPYTRHHFGGVWYVRTTSMMDEALEWIIDRKTGEFLLTPEEFSDAIETMKTEQASTVDFFDRLTCLVMKKHGRKPDSKYHVKRDLMQGDIDAQAPDYVKNAKNS